MLIVRDRLLIILLLAVAAGWTGCDDYPKDPQKTLEQVRGSTLRVGATEARPWIWRAGDQAHGVEADLVREFAGELGAEVKWVWGSQDEHFAALEEWKLHLLVGGLTQDNPWKNRVGLTRPLIDYPVVIATPPGQPAPASWENVEVAVPPASALAARVEELGAVAAPTEDWLEKGPELSQPAAVPEWAARTWGLQSSGKILTRRRQVMAVPPGENAFLVRLERFLHARKAQMPDRLARTLKELANASANRPPSTQVITQPTTQPATTQPAPS